MAITLATADLVQPEGDLAHSFFPDGDLDDHIDGWLSRAAGKVQGDSDIADSAQDTATAAWVYYLAYTYIANRIGAMPNSTAVNSGDVSVAYGQDRPAYWRALAAEQKAGFEATIVPVVVAATVTTPRVSMGVPVQAVW